MRQVIATIAVATFLVACSPESAPSSLADDVPLQSGPQTTLFEAMGFHSLAVDGAGVLYLGGGLGMATVAPGGDKPTALKAGSLPVGTFAVAPDGTLAFVTQTPQRTVETLRPGAARPEALPFGTLTNWSQIAVGNNGAVYLADNKARRLLELEPGAAEPTAVPVDGLAQIGHMVIDADDNLYAYMNKKIVKIAAGATSVEPVEGASDTVGGLAVDAAGNLYASDNEAGTVSRRPAGGGDWVELPLKDIQSPTDIAVDGEGNLYVIAAEKWKGRQVIKLAAR